MADSSAYVFLPDVAIADVAFRATGRTLDDLFEACAAALTEVMVDRESLRAHVKRQLNIKAPDADRLLYDFLTELIIVKDVDSLLFKSFSPMVTNDGTTLACELSGEEIDRERHKLRNDVKAVTMHMFGVKHDAATDRWTATVVLDI